MKLDEAKQLLQKNGYSLVEGSMSLKNKIANAKNFNRDITEMNNEPKRLVIERSRRKKLQQLLGIKDIQKRNNWNI